MKLINLSYETVLYGRDRRHTSCEHGPTLLFLWSKGTGKDGIGNILA